jgi:hypothetical protein
VAVMIVVTILGRCPLTIDSKRDRKENMGQASVRQHMSPR